MDVLTERTVFTTKDSSSALPVSVQVVNFRRLWLRNESIIENEAGTLVSLPTTNGATETQQDVFHTIAALYSSALPDMELEAIYNSLTKTTKTVFVLATKESAYDHYTKHGMPSTIKLSKMEEEEEEEEEEDEADDLYGELFSQSEDEEAGEEGVNGGADSDWEQQRRERESFLVRVQERRQTMTAESVGVEDRIVGAITYMRLSSKPGAQSTQVLLLAVRRRWRGYGVGSYLLRLCKDPDIVGQYDVILAYADHKAEDFFSRHGFSDDPIITSRHKKQTDYWENSTLMGFIPPYSAVCSSLKSLEAMDDEIKSWRSLSMAAHCQQVCIMERLRQEVLLLHCRLASREDTVEMLQRDLRAAHVERQIMEAEHSAYRQRMQARLLELTQQNAAKWIRDAEDHGRNGTRDIVIGNDVHSLVSDSSRDRARDEPSSLVQEEGGSSLSNNKPPPNNASTAKDNRLLSLSELSSAILPHQYDCISEN